MQFSIKLYCKVCYDDGYDDDNLYFLTEQRAGKLRNRH